MIVTWQYLQRFFGLNTDVPEYHGAASLDIDVVNDKVEILIGHYWTNRSWQKAINTAGEIKLTRIEM